MTRFNTLLQREWMQHQRGWIALIFVPLALLLLAAIFGTVIFNIDSDEASDTVIQHVPDALLIAGGSIGALTLGILLLSWFSALFMAPGLARRDRDDRSIEFWLSLPVSHVQSLGSMLLAHLVLVPWLALSAGMVGGWIIAIVLVLRNWGAEQLLGLPWGTLIAASAAVGVRLAVGVVLATLWLSPLIMAAMAASAWLKRLGVPVLAVSIGLVGLIVEKLLGSRVVWDVLKRLFEEAGFALLSPDRDGQVEIKLKSTEEVLAFMQGLPMRALHDLALVLRDLASPGFVFALAVAALGFWLLLMRRARGV